MFGHVRQCCLRPSLGPRERRISYVVGGLAKQLLRSYRQNDIPRDCALCGRRILPDEHMLDLFRACFLPPPLFAEGAVLVEQGGDTKLRRVGWQTRNVHLGKKIMKAA